VAGAADSFGPEPLAAALAATTPAALTHTTRQELGDHPGLWDDLARRVAPRPAKTTPDRPAASPPQP
jgi:hypothetical protein